MNKLYIENNDFKLEIAGSSDKVSSIKFVNRVKTSNSNHYLDYVATQIIKYYKGELETFDINFDFSNCTPFQTKIYQALYDTPYGTLLTYKDLANKINSKAYQATGSAMAKNPFVIVIPCHRVINNNYNLGNYSGPDKLKEKLTTLELNKQSYKYKTTRKFNQRNITSFLNNPEINAVLKNTKLQDKIDIYHNPFSCLVSQIIYQLINYHLAKRIEVRLYDLLNYDLSANNILATSSTRLKQIGLSSNKIKHITNLCHHYENNISFWQNINNLTNDEIYSELIKIHGIGRWSIDMLLIFGLQREDIFTFDDLILKKVILQLNPGINTKTKEREFLDTINNYATITSINLWYYYLNKEKEH